MENSAVTFKSNAEKQQPMRILFSKILEFKILSDKYLRGSNLVGIHEYKNPSQVCLAAS